MTTVPPAPVTPVIVSSGPTDLAIRQNLTGDGQGLAISTSMRLDVTQENIVAIRVAEAETAIRSRVAQITRELSSLNTHHSTLTGERDLFLSDWCKAQAANDTRIKPFIAAATVLLGKTPSVSYGVAAYDPRSDTLNATLSISGEDLSFSMTYSSSPPASFHALLDAIKDVLADISTKQREVAAGRLALNNVDALERQARAALAKTLVARTGEAGQALVKAIQDGAASNTDDLIAALGL